MGGVWKDIWTSLRSVAVATASVVAFGLAVLGSLWNPGIEVKIGLIWLVVIILVIVVALATAIKMAMDARRSARGDLPRAVAAIVPAAATDRKQAVTLVMGRSRQFGVNILVTIYHEERLSAERTDIIEQAIGIGQVINIQENGLIQVLVVREEPIHAALWQRIRNRETPVLVDVVVKPSIDFNALGIEVRIDE
jgi:hypothetical protein